MRRQAESPADPATRLAEVVRDDWGRLISLLVGRFRRLDLAEDALGDAVLAATKSWPQDGVPDNPSAWLHTAARRRALDRLRAEMVAAKVQPLLVTTARTAEQTQQVNADPGDELTDELLRLVFCCAHPALDRQVASALTLRLVLGVPTADIARLFLVSDQTMAARLTRAKRKITTAGVPFVIPAPEELAGRLDDVAEIAYLAFTSGYAPGSGDAAVRIELSAEAIRLTRTVRRLLPDSAVLTALLALMLLQHSRRDARIGADGALVLLPDQDRTRWRHDEIAEAVGLLTRLLESGADRDPHRTRRFAEYLLQALIAAEHAVAPTAADTDWARIAGWYAELEQLGGSPVVRLNRAVAVAEAAGEDFGPIAGLTMLDGLDERLPGSHRLPAVRAELLARIGDRAGAADQLDLAIERCGNDAERRHLQRRRAEFD